MFVSSNSQALKDSPPADTVSSWVERNAESRTVCACSRNNNHNQNEGSDVSDTSVPLISRTPSSVCPASPTYHDPVPDNLDRLDDVDGLPVIHCDVQTRVQQIIVEHKVSLFLSTNDAYTVHAVQVVRLSFFLSFQLKEEALRKELHTTRMALIKQVCNHTAEADRVDDIVS